MNDYRICGTCMVALPTTEQAKLYNEKLGKNVMKPAVPDPPKA